MEDLGILSGLFASAFLAATILPAQSELLLASLTASGKYNIYILLAAAVGGNVAGSILNYYIGRYLEHYKDHKYFPIKKNLLKKAEKQYSKYGPFTLLFAWVPVIGDPLTFIAGFFRTNIWLFTLLVTIGKAIRYILVVYLAYHI
jgi:membrane protein YqaA with SNARE-associated domain